jgi:hypothetical protein
VGLRRRAGIVAKPKSIAKKKKMRRKSRKADRVGKKR